jgi:hypothetical protein
MLTTAPPLADGARVALGAPTLIRLISVALTLGLASCGVAVEDTTPAQFPANHDIGLYEVSANVTRDLLVTPGSVYLFAIVGKQRIELSAKNPDRSRWRGFYSVRCQRSFPLQLLVGWKQVFELEQKLLPDHPREIELIEPPPPLAARIDSTGAQPKGGWQGAVQYRFVTVPTVEITGARLEPSGSTAEDLTAARAISLLTPLPLTARCGEFIDLRLASAAPRAHATLVIDTDHPTLREWKTQVEFSPR